MRGRLIIINALDNLMERIYPVKPNSEDQQPDNTSYDLPPVIPSQTLTHIGETAILEDSTRTEVIGEDFSPLIYNYVPLPGTNFRSN